MYFIIIRRQRMKPVLLQWFCRTPRFITKCGLNMKMDWLFIDQVAFFSFLVLSRFLSRWWIPSSWKLTHSPNLSYNQIKFQPTPLLTYSINYEVVIKKQVLVGTSNHQSPPTKIELYSLHLLFLKSIPEYGERETITEHCAYCCQGCIQPFHNPFWSL